MTSATSPADSTTLSAQRRKTLGTIVGLLVAAPALLIVMGVALEGQPLAVLFPADAPTVSPIVLLVNSPFSLAAMVIASLIMAGLIIARPTRVMAVIAVVFTVFFAVFDVVELVSKAQAGLIGFVVIALVVLVVRAVTVALSLRLARA